MTLKLKKKENKSTKKINLKQLLGMENMYLNRWSLSILWANESSIV